MSWGNRITVSIKLLRIRTKESSRVYQRLNKYDQENTSFDRVRYQIQPHSPESNTAISTDPDKQLPWAYSTIWNSNHSWFINIPISFAQYNI